MAEEDRSSRIDALFGHLDKTIGHAMVVGVVNQGRVVHRRGYGYANREHRVPAGATTAFRMASNTKQFTCAGILLLADEGKLSLDDDVRNHLPAMSGLAATVRLRDMMHSASSLPDFNGLLLLGEADTTALLVSTRWVRNLRLREVQA
jgi:CubicO group peptidase (beta-lactamase class C family)